MFFFLSKTLDLAFSPLAWALLLLVYSAFIANKNARKRASLLLAFALLYVFSLESVSTALLNTIEQGAPFHYESEKTYDAAVILGGFVELSDHKGLPENTVIELPHSSPLSQDQKEGEEHAALYTSLNNNVERLLTAYDLLRKNKVRYAILTGALFQTDTSDSEALRMKNILVSWGISEDRLFLEPKAKNTHENALYSMKLAEEKNFSSLLIVTSAFHMKRSYGTFEKENQSLPHPMALSALPVDYRSTTSTFSTLNLLPRPEHLQDSSLVLRELAGRWIYKLKGYSL